MNKNYSSLKIILFIVVSMLFMVNDIKASEDAIAKIGENEYESLQEAIDAAENNEMPTIIEIIRMDI